jgi:nondiscriminating glutamyl-tRNA synthetase
MSSLDHIQPHPARESLFTAKDILTLLQERHWLSADPAPDHLAFCERAAALLGPHAADPSGLADLLQLIFHYDAAQILQTVEAHAVLSRYGARDVIRELALFLLDPAPFNSDRFKVIVAHLKETVDVRSRDLFHPIRLALAGRAGEGELDRVILLLDEAAALPFDVPTKSARNRILEFCSALD